VARKEQATTDQQQQIMRVRPSHVGRLRAEVVPAMQSSRRIHSGHGVLPRVAAAGPGKERATRSEVGRPTKLTNIDCGHCGKNYKPVKSISKYCSTACAKDALAKRYRLAVDAMIAAGSLPPTALEADSQKVKWYFTGVPCLNGHIDARDAKTKCCVACAKVRHKKDSELRRVGRQKKEVIVESLQTNSMFLHLLGVWRPVAVGL
jgi:hypothetical protein